MGLAPRRAGKIARGAAGVGSLVVLGMAFDVGRSGGELVYREGAVAAYVTSDGGSTSRTHSDHDDDVDDDDDRR